MSPLDWSEGDVMHSAGTIQVIEYNQATKINMDIYGTDFECLNEFSSTTMGSLLALGLENQYTAERSFLCSISQLFFNYI